LIDRGIYFGGWERLTIEFIDNYVKPGYVVIEVGANVGSHTLNIAKKVGINGKVYAFEPTNFARGKLADNIQLNENLAPIVEVCNYLVTDHDNSVPRRDVRSSWNISDKDHFFSEKVISDSISLDAFTKINDINKVDVIKVDVDGYDCKVIFGASEIIKKNKPIVYIELCEYALNEQGNSIDELFLFFSDMGYSKVLHEDGTSIHSPSQVKSIIGLDRSINAIFLFD